MSITSEQYHDLADLFNESLEPITMLLATIKNDIGQNNKISPWMFAALLAPLCSHAERVFSSGLAEMRKQPHKDAELHAVK